MINLLKGMALVIFLSTLLFRSPLCAQTLLPKESKKADENSGSAAAEEDEVEIQLETDAGCFLVKFNSPAGRALSCIEGLPIQYLKQDCKTQTAIERGQVEAAITCEEKNYAMRFKTSSELIFARLSSIRDNRGRGGVAQKYIVKDAKKEESAFSKYLPVPTIVDLVEKKPIETPIKWKFYGFAWVEHERSSKFGYDQGSTRQTAQPNFTSRGVQPKQNNTTFFSNFGIEVGKDSTNLVSQFEIGEIFFGDSNSGGAKGARSASTFELRNLYLDHQISSHLWFTSGLITTVSDPRSFIFSDHLASLQSTFKTDFSEGLLWYGSAAQNLPAASYSKDQYLGVKGTLGFLSSVKGSVYGVYRSLSGEAFAVPNGSGGYVEAVADSESFWLGGTFDYTAYKPFAAQFTVIGNWVNLATGSAQTAVSSYLSNAKLSYSGDEIIYSIEGLVTPGASGVIESSTGKPHFGKRKSFSSPVGWANLLSIATSDGVDDAPGTPKQSSMANLSQDEGLVIVVTSVAKNFTRNLTSILRYGYLASSEKSSTGSTDYGQEVDVQFVYQATPSMSLQFDYGIFMPGKFFAERDPAELIALKSKFTF